MRIGLITAGAAGMFCGSCMRDNTLANALIALKHEALLIPTYTPIKTDEVDASQKRVFFGGINVYLQQKSWIFRRTPWLLDRVLDAPRLLRYVSRFASRTPYSALGKITVSMLQGDDGFQRKEIAKLVEWLKTDFKPDVLVLTNVLLSGMAPHLKRDLGIPIFATLQGDDIFLDALPEPYRQTATELIGMNAQSIDGFISTSAFYATSMTQRLHLDRERIHVVYPGISLKGYGGNEIVPTKPPYRIGYFARICPEKGFQNIIDAFIALRSRPGAPACTLKASGWLGENHQAFYQEQVRKLEVAGFASDFEYTDAPDHASKVRFFRSVDVVSVPTTYHEPKGLYILEAMANGVPVVQPDHGSFPELIGLTGGGLLVAPNNPQALADGLQQLLEDSELRRSLGQKGKLAVNERFHAEQMARDTLRVLSLYLPTETPRP